MEKIKEYITRPLVVGITAFILGLIIGWMLLGWVIAPVSWTDASPKHLQVAYRVDYLKMAIKMFSVDKNLNDAKFRWEGLQDTATSTLAELQKDTTVKAGDVANFQTAVTGAVAPAAGTPAAGATEVAPVQKPTTGGGLLTSPITYLVIFCLLALVILAALLYVLFIRRRTAGTGAYSSAVSSQAAEASRQAPRTDFTTTGQEPPVAQFMTTYMLGDDLYDDSFSIDAPSGEFLGECGVGISDTIGVGDPKKVTAFEVWLFDKNDIQTVTKVLMSQHAMNDQAIRQRLESKGEPVEIEAGKMVVLETATLRLEARVVDMSYGQGALPASSFFERLTLELAIWPTRQETSA